MSYQRFSWTLMLLTLLPATLTAWLVAPATADILYVPQEYPTIQDAVNAASAGDTIQVDAETYFENVIVNTTVTIVGENALTTIVDGGGNDVIFHIEADNVELRDLTIRNGSSYSGVTIYYPYDGLVIRNTRITNNAAGVIISEADDNTIEDNIFIDNSMYGIDVKYSSGNVIRDNQISESAYGVEVSDTSNSQVVNNTVHDTSYGIFVPYSNGNNISANTLTSNSWGIYLLNSDSNIVGENAVSDGSAGIQIMRSQGNSVFNNTVSDSSYGILLGHCGTNTVSGNTASLNDWGVELYNSTGSTVKENTVLDNTWGIYIVEDSDGNSIYHNDFLDNTKQAYQDIISSNTWRTGATPYQGNYWSDYIGADDGSGGREAGDGVGDTYLPWAGVDWYPLMAPLGVHDVAITNVTVSATEVYQGETVNITVTAENEGITETFTVTTYANSTFIEQQTISSLAPGASETLVFTWNTSTFSTGTYNISAEASVVPGETDTADNIYVDGAVKVKLLGDVNGDMIVDIYDLARIGEAYGSMSGDLNWDEAADMNRDGIVDNDDLAICDENYAETV